MNTKAKLFALGGAVVVALALVWGFYPSAAPEAAEAVSEDDASSAEPQPTEAADDPHSRAVARLDAALALLESDADERDDDSLVLERLAGGYLERQRWTGDWADFGRAEAALERAFARAAPHAGPVLMRAQLNYTLHRLDLIEADLQTVEAFALPQYHQLRAVRVMRANVALQSGRYDEAAAAFDELLEQERSGDALVGAAGHRLAIGAFDEADALLVEAEQLARGADPLARAWLCLVRGLVALERGTFDDALAHYRRGLEHMPGWYLLEEHVAEIFVEQGRHDEALAIYTEIIERTGDPEFMDAAAEIHEARGESETALALRERAHDAHEARIEAHPTAAYGHALDHYLAHAPDAERAVELAEANRDARPNGEAWTKLAAAYLGVGRVADARLALAEVERMPYRSGELDEVREAVAAATETE